MWIIELQILQIQKEAKKKERIISTPPISSQVIKLTDLMPRRTYMVDAEVVEQQGKCFRTKE